MIGALTLSLSLLPIPSLNQLMTDDDDPFFIFHNINEQLPLFLQVMNSVHFVHRKRPFPLLHQDSCCRVFESYYYCKWFCWLSGSTLCIRVTSAHIVSMCPVISVCLFLSLASTCWFLLQIWHLSPPNFGGGRDLLCLFFRLTQKFNSENVIWWRFSEFLRFFW